MICYTHKQNEKNTQNKNIKTMTHKISYNDLQKAVIGAYEEYQNLKKGEVDTRVQPYTDVKNYGISVVLTDGRVIEKGDTTVRAALGNIVSLPVHGVLLQQYGVKELIKKAGKTSSHKLRKMELPVCPHTLRAISAVEPQNDRDGKYDIIVNNIISMLGNEPVLNDKMYEAMKAEIYSADVENKLAEAEFTLYDDAATVTDQFAKLESLTVTTTELATLGATIAADGVNPVTKENVFDGELSAPLTTIAAIHGDPDRNRREMLKSGVPEAFSFSGLVLAILPGLGAIAVYGPEVGKHGRSKKGARAVRYITGAIGYNVFGSARVEVENAVEFSL